MMELLNSPTNLTVIGIGFAVLYSWGHYCRKRYGEYIKGIGFGGAALVVLKMFWSFCPAVVVLHLFPLLAAAIIIQGIFWVCYNIAGCSKSRKGFSFDSRLHQADDDTAEKPNRITDSIH